MNSPAASSADGAHVAAYRVPESVSAGDQPHACEVICSCGDFQRTSTSTKSGTQARANARAAFNRHRHKAGGTAAPASAPHPTPAPAPTPAPPASPTSTAAPTPSPEPEPGPEPVAAPEPLQAPPSARWLRRGVLAVATAAAVITLAVLLVITIDDRSGDAEEGASAPATSPSGPPVAGLPPLPVSVVKGPPKAVFVDLLRRADPAFGAFGGNELEAGGRAICRDYGRGIGVLEIASTILASSTLDSVQAITMIAAAGRTLCPSYAGGIGSEVSGLG